jgi:hypothetical protein
MVSEFDIAYMKACQKLGRPVFTINDKRMKGMECYYLYKLDKNNKVYHIKELDQVFGWSSNRVDTQPDFANFRTWMQGELYLIPIELGYKDMYETIYAYVLPLSHKIKHLTPEMKLVIAFIQNQDNDNFVIVSDTPINSAIHDNYLYSLWKASGLKNKTIDKLFRNKLIDDLCKVLQKRDEKLKEILDKSYISDAFKKIRFKGDK